MRLRRLVRLAIVLFLLLPFEAVAQRTSSGKAPRPRPPARVRADGDVLTRVLQREDSRWIGSDRFLADLSRSRNTTTKMRALLALGRIGDPRGLPLLFDRLGEPSALIRARALFAIGQIIDAHNLEHEGYELQRNWLSVVAALTGDADSRVRMRAIEALGKSADSTYGDRVAGVVLKNTEGSEVIAGGLLALVRMGDGKSLERAVSLRSHGSPEVRWRLAFACYRLRNSSVAVQLKPLLSDSNAQVRAQSAAAYGLVGRDAVVFLSPMLRDPSPNVRIGAARGLGLTGSEEAAAELSAFIGQRLGSIPGEEENAVTAAVEAWGDLKTTVGIENLERLARQSRPAAGAALVALAKARRGDEMFPKAIGALPAPFWLLRSHVRALGENGSPAAMQRLLAISMEGLENGLLLPWALDALVQTARPINPEAFWRYLEHPDPFLRVHALQALTELVRRGAGRQDWIAEATEQTMQSYFMHQTEPVNDARLAAVDFLATLEAGAAVPHLERIARDADRNVRLRARNALRVRFGKNPSGIAGLVNTGRNYPFYAGVVSTVSRYSGARFITDRGSWTLRFFGADAPLTVYNFITLVQRGLFDHLTFPRVVPDFVIQGGDPRNDTDGGPGYAIRCEINEQTFARGTVGMALSGKDSGGSQYFITLSPQPQLDGSYTAFAQVSDGLAVVDRILLGDRVQRIELLSQAASLGGSFKKSGAEKSNPSNRKRQ